jgi:myo-inositol-1(or 4)-monophosphatase
VRRPPAPKANKTALFNVMERAARKAARGLIRDFGEVEQLQVSLKGPADFVSTADLRAERVLRTELEHARPGYSFLMEGGFEAGKDAEHVWIVDPLDGTTNFLHGIPHFSISMALARGDDLLAGLVYDPFKDEMFYAEKGLGAFVNDRRLRVSARRELGDAVIGTGLPFRTRGDHPDYLQRLERVMGATAGVRRMGSAALDLAYVAAGRFDGFFEFGLSKWDIAAGLLLVREAGGYAECLTGKGPALESGDVLVANDHLLGPLGRLVRGPQPSQAAKSG